MISRIITIVAAAPTSRVYTFASNPAGAGSLATFTLFRQEGMRDADFERDAGMIESDQQALMRVVEALPLE